MRQVNIYDAKTAFSQLIRDVEEGEEILIARGGKPVARLVPVREDSDRKLGIDAGQGWIADDFDDVGDGEEGERYPA
jgi:prevent-host-death family protein